MKRAFIQIPIFFSLYQALLRSLELKNAPFLWIKDLSGPDKLFILSSKLPVIGNEINLLPILMAIAMFFQQKSSVAASAGSNEQQRIMLIMFPILFLFIMYHLPSGLVLYWLTNTILMLFNHTRINRLHAN